MLILQIGCNISNLYAKQGQIVAVSGRIIDKGNKQGAQWFN